MAYNYISTTAGNSVNEYNRFLRAQNGLIGSYDQALAEIRSGRKQGHWIWYIFPQLAGLGHSYNSEYYAIRDLAEARQYLQNDILRGRLIEISEALLNLDLDIRQIMWSPDDRKVRSCMTLFREADPSIDVFQKVLDKFFQGKPDGRTLRMLGENRGHDTGAGYGEDGNRRAPSAEPVGYGARFRECIEKRKEVHVSSCYGDRKIVVFQGDMTDYSDKVDLLTLSAFRYNYAPSYGTVIGTLEEKCGISTQDLSRRPALDMRDFCGCWVSKEIPYSFHNPQFRRIGCMEMTLGGSTAAEDLLILIQSYFRIMDLLSLQNISLKRIMMPLVGTGNQGLDPRLIVLPLINEAVNYLRRSETTREIVFVERSKIKADLLVNALESSYSIMNDRSEEKRRKERDDRRGVVAFISFSGEDQGIAELMRDRLEAFGIRCWYAPRDIIQGNYAGAIVRAISECSHFITIISENSMNSEHVLNEIDLAFDQLKRGIVLLPFRIDNHDLRAEFNYYLKRQQWTQAQKPPMERRIEEFIRKVFF